MTIPNASPSLYNEDLAPATERKWGAFSIFNVWTSDVHSLWGYYLAASLFLLCGSFVNFLIAIGLGSLVIFFLMNLVGYAGVKTGVPYPVLARASFGVWGANVPALVRAVVACFWYGAQTAAATWITYFAALYLNFCDFSRYAPDKATVRKGNLWGLPINLVLFSLVAGITTIAAFKVYGEVMLHPEQISAKFDSWFLALLAALTFAVATLGINVVANFVSPAFDFSNVFPRVINFKRGGYIAAGIALILYPFAPWEGNAAAFVGAIGATMGPLLGVILVDYYLIAKGSLNVDALHLEHGEYRYQGGFNVVAFIAAGVGALFSSILPNFSNVLPSWWGIYGWFFGVAIAGATYLVLTMLVPRAKAQPAA